MGPVAVATDPTTADPAELLSELLTRMDLLIEEQRKGNELTKHLISAVNRRSLWED